MDKIFVFLVLMTGCLAQARTFNALSDRFAVYVKGTMDRVISDNTLVSKSKGSNVNLDTDIQNKMSGELGVLFAREKLNLRIGLEYIRPLALENKQGTRTSDGSAVYNASSEISVLAPKMTIEFNLKRTPSSRFFISAAGGYATIDVRNEYALTTTGRTVFNNINDFDEQLTGISYLYEGTFGYENLLADSTTFVLEAGYRSLIFDSISYKKIRLIFKAV
jgi:hypothetical protein